MAHDAADGRGFGGVGVADGSGGHEEDEQAQEWGHRFSDRGVQPVIERRAQAAIEPCPLVVREIATSETMTAFLDLTRIGRAYRRLTNFIDIAQPDGTLNAVYG